MGGIFSTNAKPHYATCVKRTTVTHHQPSNSVNFFRKPLQSRPFSLTDTRGVQ